VQDLLDANAGDPTDGVPEGGVFIEGVRFYDFVYSNTGPNAPSASEVEVQQTSGPSGTFGIEFNFDWVAAAGDNMRSTIRYKVDSPTPLDLVGLFFDGDVPPGNEGVGTFAQVTETVRTLAGTGLGELSVFDDGTGPGVDNNVDELDLTPPQTDIELSKAIRVRAGGSGVATISVVDNYFRPIPEPAAFGLLAAGTMLGLRRRRR